MQRPIYLDYNATTPLHPAVLDVMLPYFTERFGNPSSGHPYGYQAHEAVEKARARVASLIGASPDEIVFTGGGSESDNLALEGAVFRHPDSHAVVAATSHPAVLATARYLRDRFKIDYTLVRVDELGSISPDALRASMRPNTRVVSVIHANNEVGTIQAIRPLADIAHEHGALVHVDAAQSAGKVPVHVEELGADLLTIAAHKLYGPKGVGALYVRRGTPLDALIHGGSQEQGRRAGTENVPGIVGLGAAARLAQAQLSTESSRQAGLRDLLHDLLAQEIPGLRLNGDPHMRLPNTLNVSFPGVLGSRVLAEAPEIAASTGSACHTGAPEPSSVLLAMGLPPERALGAVRLSLGRWTTEDDIRRAAQALTAAFRMVSGAAPAARA